MKSIAACTTATGRSMIMKAKDFVEKNYNADVIYGDTDSIFCKFVLKNKGKEAVAEAIEKGLEVEKAIAKHLRAYKPQALNYEKVLYPFILFSKKRYIGLLYETDPTKCKEKSMGIALKRRDSSKIMKVVYGNILKKILWENDLPGSFQLLEEYLKQIVNGDVEIDMLVISKTLRRTYKDPTKINAFIKEQQLKDKKLRYFGVTGGGYTTSGLWRGRYGHEIGFWTEFRNTSKPIVFRRISSNTRKFACVYTDTLSVKNDSFLDKTHDTYREIQPDGEIPSMCKCARHKGSLVVDWKIKPDFELYYEIGDYKG
jgi:hypothetical protein